MKNFYRFFLIIFSISVVLLAQNNPPVIDSIITPYDNQVFSYPNIYVKVEASDTDNGIKSLEIKVNDSEWMKAKEPSLFYNEDSVFIYENNWMLGVDLELGINTIKIKAIDSLDLISDEFSMNVYYEIGNVENWVLQESGTSENLNSVFFVNENLGWAVGDSGIILNTNNGGLTWNHQNSNLNTDLYTIYFVNENIGWAAGEGILDTMVRGYFYTPILKTTNGGKKWEIISEVKLERINIVHFFDISNGCIYGWDVNFVNTLKSNDGGISWPNSGDLGASDYEEFFSIAAIDTDNIWLAGEDINHWEAVLEHRAHSTYINRFDRIHYNRFHYVEFFDKNNGWIIAHTVAGFHPGNPTIRENSVSALKTTDAGMSWIRNSVGIRGPYGKNSKDLNADFIDMQTGWIVTTYGLIVHTTNGGEDWIIDGSINGKDLRSVKFINKNTGYAVGDEGTILKYSNIAVQVELISLGIIPDIFSLSQNYPNPFNPTTKIKYSIPQTNSPLPGGVRGGLVTLRIYDILGNEISTLVNEVQSPGNYEVTFDAASLANGIYFYELKSGGFNSVKKMILLK